MRHDSCDQLIHLTTKQIILEGAMQKHTLIFENGEPIGDEDAAKSYRGFHWAWFTLLMMIVLTGLLFLGGIIKLNLSNGYNETPEKPPTEVGP